MPANVCLRYSFYKYSSISCQDIPFYARYQDPRRFIRYIRKRLRGAKRPADRPYEAHGACVGLKFVGYGYDVLVIVYAPQTFWRYGVTGFESGMAENAGGDGSHGRRGMAVLPNIPRYDGRNYAVRLPDGVYHIYWYCRLYFYPFYFPFIIFVRLYKNGQDTYKKNSPQSVICFGGVKFCITNSV